MGSRTVGLRFPPLGSLSDLPACWGKRQMVCSPQYPTVHGAWTVAPGTVLFPQCWTLPCPCQLDHRHHVTGTTTILLRSPMAGEGSAWKGAALPPNTPLAHPSQENISKALAAHGGGSAGLAGADREGMGLYTGSSLRRLLGCCWLLQETRAQSRGGTQAGGHKTRTDAAASTAGGAEEPQGWLQSCGAAVAADKSVAQIRVAMGSWMR